MTGTAVKDMFGRILDTEAPPPRPVDEVITRNGRLLRRRRFGGALAAALLLVAAGVGAGALRDTGKPPPHVAAPPEPVSRTSPSAAAPTRPPDRVLYAVKRRLTTLAQVLEAAVPPGYKILDDNEVRGSDGVVYPLWTVNERRPADPADWNDEHNWVYTAALEVRAGGRAAVLTLEAFPLDPTLAVDPAADLCRTPLPGQVGDACEVGYGADGLPVRVSSYDDPASRRVEQAVRFYPTFAIRVTQGPRARPGVPGLDTPVLDLTGLINLAASPQLAPER